MMLTTITGFPVEMPPGVVPLDSLYTFYQMKTQRPVLVRYINFTYDDQALGSNASIRVFLRDKIKDRFIIAPTNQYLICNSRRNYTRAPVLLDLSPGVMFAPGDVWEVGSDNQATYWYYFPMALYGEEVLN